MNENDLRVIKTRENIEAALIELLKSKPIEKISVIELSRAAKINKSTFYLHYQDIQDLYRQVFLKIVEAPFQDGDFFSDFFFDPVRFFDQLGNAMLSNIPIMFTVTHNHDDIKILREVLSIECKKVYETGLIEKNVENDMKLEAIFSATLFIMPKYHQEHKKQGHEYLAAMVRALFPDMVK